MGQRRRKPSETFRSSVYRNGRITEISGFSKSPEFGSRKATGSAAGAAGLLLARCTQAAAAQGVTPPPLRMWKLQGRDYSQPGPARVPVLTSGMNRAHR
jgi:hypothetical protein